MKPRTKLHFEVWDLYKHIPEPIEHEPYVIKKHDFYYTTHYKNIVCLECNHKWKPIQFWHEELLDVECPSCKKKLQKISTKNGGMACRIITYSVAQVVDRFQVIRYFSCWKHMSKNKVPRYSFHSLFEEWKDWEKNKRVIIGRTRGWTGDGFNSIDYEIRNPNARSWSGSDYDRFVSDYNCPGAQFLPRFDKYNLTFFDHDCDWRHLISKIEYYSSIETILKSKQKELLVHAVHKDNTHLSYWPQIKIAIRNRYIVSDATIWYDYLKLLRFFNKDLHNPKFILPKNLKKEHDVLVAKKARIDEINERNRIIQKEIDERAKAEAEEALKGIKAEVFKDFVITKGKIKIVSLIDDKEVKNEGKVLKHCVYRNDYHKKSGILLLSARINNKPIETIELSLANYNIIQARGYENEPSMHHNEILEIIRSNINKIIKIVEKCKKLKELDNNLSKLEKVA